MYPFAVTLYHITYTFITTSNFITTINMIDLNLHIDLELGPLYQFTKNHKLGKTYKTENFGTESTDHKFIIIAKLVLLFTIYTYFILCTLVLIVSMLTECKLKPFALRRFHRVSDMINFHLTYVKLLSSILVGFLVIRDCIIYRHFGCFIGLLRRLS